MCFIQVLRRFQYSAMQRRLDVQKSKMWQEALTFRLLPDWDIMPKNTWHDIQPSHIKLTPG